MGTATAEGVYYEVEQIKTDLLAAIQAHATKVVGTAMRMILTPSIFLHDTNGNGLVDPEES
jgi:hypothetical protein